MGKKSVNSVPDRWLDYSRVGNVLPGTRFVCFKTPLRMQICGKLNRNDHFVPSQLVRDLPPGYYIKLIIDLTKTDRYYDPTDYTKCDIQHKKIKCGLGGHDVPPTEEEWKEFSDTVDAFLASNQDEKALVGVHCTHGVNRTGYLVCRYLMERIGKSARDSMICFGDARGHKMEKYHEMLFELEKALQNPGTATPTSGPGPETEKLTVAQKEDQ